MRGRPEFTPIVDVVPCQYGCGNDARFLIGKKMIPCCCSSLYSCSAIQARKQLIVQKCLGTLTCSYGCSSPANFLIGVDKTPCCSKTISSCLGIRSKTVSTNIRVWGTPCTLMNPEVQKKGWARLSAPKIFTLPSGRVISLRGYEPEVLQHLLTTRYSESDFDFDTNLSIDYTSPITGNPSSYYPDFYLPKLNKVIEVKSEYTYALGPDSYEGVTNLAKAAAAKQKYDFSFAIWKDGELLDNDSLLVWRLNHQIARQRAQVFPQTGYQRHVREVYDILAPREIVPLKGAYVEEISKQEAENLILKYEWLQSMAMSTVAHYGLKVGDELLGVVCFSSVGGPAGSVTYRDTPTICLSRGACVHYAHRNAASFLISRACKLASKKYGWKIFFAYSDEEAGEIGTVYQACNWWYLGENIGRTPSSVHYDYISPDGTRILTSYRLNHDTKRVAARELGWLPEKGGVRPYLRSIGWQEIVRKGKKKWVHATDKKYLDDVRFPYSKEYPKRIGVQAVPSLKVIPEPFMAKKFKQASLRKSWDIRKARGDKFNFSDPIPIVNGIDVCSYGCGQIAKFFIGKTKVNTPCCSADLQLCPAQHKSRNSSEELPSESTILCKYGCGNLAKYTLGGKKYPCCESSYTRCPRHKQSHIGKGGRPAGSKNQSQLIPDGVVYTCVYGCGGQAKYFSTNKRIPCCSDHHRKCPGFAAKDMHIKETSSDVLCSYGCNKDAHYLLGVSERPCCSRSFYDCPGHWVNRKTLADPDLRQKMETTMMEKQRT